MPIKQIPIPVIRGKVDEVPPKRFEPVGDLVALHMHPVEENEVGILLPDGSENPKQTNICTVIAAGPLCKQVKEGDKVYIQQVMATFVYIDGRQYITIKEEHVAGIVIPQ